MSYQLDANRRILTLAQFCAEVNAHDILPCIDTAKPIAPVFIATRFAREGTFQLREVSAVVESVPGVVGSPTYGPQAGFYGPYKPASACSRPIRA